MQPTQASVDRSVFNAELAANKPTIAGANSLMEQAAWMVRGEVGYKRKALQIRAGAAVLDGDPFSFGHYYRNNASVYLLLKYAI